MPINPCKLTINLRVIKSNYNYLNSLSSARTGAVVKANACGLGALEVTQVLQKAGCYDFFTAYLQEGINLRTRFTGGHHIYILHGIFDGEEAEFVHYNLLPVLNTAQQAFGWQKQAQALGKKLPCVIHADSGITRLGMSEEELRLAAQMPELDVVCLMSHLACADEFDHEYNHYQLKRFNSYHHMFPNAKFSFANSSGIFLGKEFHFDILRPGAALFGLNPIIGRPNPMQNPITLTSQIIQIREMTNSSFVGYGATYKASKGVRIATIAIGYADGFLRHLSNSGFVYINGKKVSIIGRVSMDLITLDVTNVPCRIGDQVEIIGKNSHPDNIAKLAGTIGNEILTSLGDRYERIYVDDDKKSE